MTRQDKPTYSQAPGVRPLPTNRTELTQSFGATPKVPGRVLSSVSATDSSSTAPPLPTTPGGSSGSAGTGTAGYASVTVSGAAGLLVNGDASSTRGGKSPSFALSFLVTDALLKGDTFGGLVGAVAGTDYSLPIDLDGVDSIGNPISFPSVSHLSVTGSGGYLGADGGDGHPILTLLGGTSGGSMGTVTSVGMTVPSGFSVAPPTITTASTFVISTTLSGVLKGTGSGITAATASPGNTTGDYVAPTDARLSDARVTVRRNSTATTVGPRRRLNFVEGTNISLLINDDLANDEIDIQISASSSAVTPTATTTITGTVKTDVTQSDPVVPTLTTYNANKVNTDATTAEVVAARQRPAVGVFAANLYSSLAAQVSGIWTAIANAYAWTLTTSGGLTGGGNVRDNLNVSIATNGVTTVKIADGNVTAAKLASGGTTPSATKYYRGDGTWQTVGGGSSTAPYDEITTNGTVVGLVSGTAGADQYQIPPTPGGKVSILQAFYADVTYNVDSSFPSCVGKEITIYCYSLFGDYTTTINGVWNDDTDGTPYDGTIVLRKEGDSCTLQVLTGGNTRIKSVYRQGFTGTIPPGSAIQVLDGVIVSYEEGGVSDTP